MKIGAIGEALEIFQEEAEKGLSTAKQQITGKKPGQAGQTQAQQQGNQAAQQQPPPIADQTAANLPSESIGSNQPQDDSSKQFIQDLYGGKASSITEEEIQQKELEDKQKQEALRQKLHREYYEKLVTPAKQKEPRIQEKIEQEEEEKKQAIALEEEKKKKDELPVVVTKDMGTKEKLRGVSG